MVKLTLYTVYFPYVKVRLRSKISLCTFSVHRFEANFNNAEPISKPYSNDSKG